MDLTLNNIVSILSIIGFACGAIHYIVIRPLQGSINVLCKAVSEVRTLIKNLETQNNKDALQIETRLVKVESSIKSAHYRLDHIEGDNHVGSM